jgi:hypothetical protein
VQTVSTSPDALAERLFAAALGAIELLAAYLGADRQPVASESPQPTEYVAEVNELTRVGTLWQVSCAGISVHLPDLRGIADLAVLLAAPGRDFPALDLATSAPAARHRTTRRGARAQQELDFLTGELTAACGLRGPRRAGDPAEKARSAVTARIRTAIARIGDAHPGLGSHLSGSVRTGRFCSYRPDGATAWRVSRRVRPVKVRDVA